MRAPLRFVAAVAPLLPLLLCATACGSHFPSEPKGVDTLMAKATLSNAQGIATIVEAGLYLDSFSIADSCPPVDEVQPLDSNGVPYTTCDAPAISAVTLAGSGEINPGAHTLSFGLPETNASRPVSYTVSGFSLAIHDSGGKLIKTMTFPDQTVVVPLGKGINYAFSF